jgi:hypothetical protein
MAGSTPAQTITSSGTAETASPSYFASGDVNSYLRANNQVRRIAAYTSGTQVTVNAPFSPDLAAGTAFEKITLWTDTTRRLWMGLLVVSDANSGAAAGGAYPFVIVTAWQQSYRTSNTRYRGPWWARRNREP